MTGAWPRYKGRPLCCVAQLDLADVRAIAGPDWLPPDGRLLFFYELEAATWGLYTEDLGSFAVIHQGRGRLPAADLRLPQDGGLSGLRLPPLRRELRLLSAIEGARLPAETASRSVSAGDRPFGDGGSSFGR